MNNNQLEYVTSFDTPESKLRLDRWGASSSPSLIPFQVMTKEANSIHSSDGKIGYYYEGITESKINSLNSIEDNQLIDVKPNQLGLGLSRHNIWFRPNPVVTVLDPSLKFRIPYQGAPMNNIPWLPTLNNKGEKSMWLAAVNFVCIDIDFKNTSQEKAEQLIRALEVPPTTIVASGNGFHIYFSVKRIECVTGRKIDFSTDLITSDAIEYRLKYLTSSISKKLGGDPRADNCVFGLLRVPNTKNYKIQEGHPIIKDCYYIKGDLREDYRNPKYTLDSLINIFCPELNKCKSATRSEHKGISHNPRKRPRIDTKGWRIAYGNLLGFFKLDKQTKSFGKYFEYIYGHRNLDYYIENPSKSYGKRAGIKSDALKKVREKMIALGVIEKIDDHDRYSSKSAKYRPTALFFKSCGISKIKANVYKSLPYDPGKLRERMIIDLKFLAKQGKTPSEVEIYIKRKIQNRKAITGDEEELLRWGLQVFFNS